MEEILAISFFCATIQNQGYFHNAREMLAFQRAFLKMTLVRTHTFAKGKSRRDDFANAVLNCCVELIKRSIQ